MRKRKVLIALLLLVLVVTFGAGCLANTGGTSIPDNTIISTTTSNITSKSIEISQKEVATSTIKSAKNEITTTTSKEATKPTTIETKTAQTKILSKTEETKKIITKETFKVEEKKPESRELPEPLMKQVQYWKRMYPNMEIGVGLYSLDGKKGYEYNVNQRINGACTIKASFAKYVLETCQTQGIDIWNTYITFEARHDNFGSGNIILYGQHGYNYSIGYLVNQLLTVSDNVAYNMLLDRFPFSGFWRMLKSIGGQDDKMQWGAATVAQRRNEWLDIYKFVNSGGKYAETLRQDLTNTAYAYIPQGMVANHNYMHKSGWTDNDYEYPASGDCAIIDDKYLLIVLTQDKSIGSGHINVIQFIGNATEAFYNTNNGNIWW